MEVKIQYKLHLTLRQRAALRTAILFWENKEVKDRVTKFFESCGKIKSNEANKQWRELTQALIEEWYKDKLPQELEDELIHIVKMIGKTIHNWYNYIMHEFDAEEEAINCIDKIHWTPYGTVDAVEVFKSSWLDNPNLDIAKVYYYACCYVLEDHIDYLWPKLPDDIFESTFDDVFIRFDRHIIAYWKCCKNDDLPNLMRYFEMVANHYNTQARQEFNRIYDLTLSIEENMFRLSVYQGYYLAVKYFWEKLTEEKRDKNVLQCARITVICYNSYASNDMTVGDYYNSQYVEICIFLMNQMSKSHKKAFFNEQLGLESNNFFNFYFKYDVKDNILKMLLSTWPWQELFVPVLKDMLQYQDDHSQMACRFLNTITEKMLEDYRLNYSLETSIYRLLLRKAWLILTESIKEKIVQNYVGYEFVENLIDVWDIGSLKLIINDPEITSFRNFFIELGLDSYKQLIIDDEYEKLEQFIEEIFTSEEDKKLFKHQLELPWHDFIIEENFYLADKLLDWLCSTPEEKKSVKNSIDYIEFCDEFIEMYNYKLVDKFLDWKFDTEEEKIKCKEYFKSHDFLNRRVCDIWKEYTKEINDAKEKSSQFLQWFFKSEEEVIRFKKEKIVEFDEDEFITYLVEFDRDGIIDHFFSWCLLNEEQILRLKQAVAQANQRV